MSTPRKTASRSGLATATGPSPAPPRAGQPRRGRAAVQVAPALARVAPVRARGSLAPPRDLDVRILRRAFGLNRPEFGRLLGYSERMLAMWETDERKPDAVARRRYQELQRLFEELSRIIRPKRVPEWLDTPNRSFKGLKPVEVIERGRIDWLWQMIYESKYGIAT
jgi:transcriptional regulator with XRE-family HTH domain